MTLPLQLLALVATVGLAAGAWPVKKAHGHPFGYYLAAIRLPTEETNTVSQVSEKMNVHQGTNDTVRVSVHVQGQEQPGGTDHARHLTPARSDPR